MMAQSSENPSVMIISYDCGRGNDGKIVVKTLRVSHQAYENDSDFKKFVVNQKCLKCNLETDFVKGRFI